MAGVTCGVCGERNSDGEALCRACGNFLAEDGERLPATPVQATAPAPAAVPVLGSDTCPTCGADVPDAANLVCVECLQPLTARSPGAPVGPTRRSEPAVHLVLAGQRFAIPRSGALILGRDPAQSPAAALLAGHDNVSRRHASVGVDPDGSTWVRDENSTNGTFVNDRPVLGGHTAPLAPGDRLRIASDVVARVEGGADRTT